MTSQFFRNLRLYSTLSALFPSSGNIPVMADIVQMRGTVLTLLTVVMSNFLVVLNGVPIGE